jgi:hypothetical protein
VEPRVFPPNAIRNHKYIVRLVCLESYEESEDEANIITHEEAKRRHAQWV